MIRALLAAAALVLIVPAPAGAAGAAGDVAEARSHFERGAGLFRAGDYRQAIVEFEAAYRLKPHGSIHFNLAQCHEKLDEWPAALRGYEDYLRELPDARDRAAVRAAIGRIERRLAAAGVQALLVYTDPPGAEVRIDGRTHGRSPFHITLPPGVYRVTLSLDGHQPEERQAEVSASATQVLDLMLRPVTGAVSEATPGAPGAAGVAPAAALAAPAAVDLAPRPAVSSLLGPSPEPSRPAAKRRVYTWVAAGMATAAGLAGAWMGVAAKRQQDRLLDGSPHPDAAALARDAQRKATAANVLYGLSGVAAAAGVTLFYVEGRF
jgi:hypothetical protein